MRKFFFEKGEELKINALSFIRAPQRIDSRVYLLDRVENPPENYVFNNYSSFDHINFIRYLTCWEETQKVEVKRPKKQEIKKEAKQSKLVRKTTLSAFLTKKKKTLQENQLLKTQQTPQNISSKKQTESPPETEDRKVLYVQLEAFSPVQVPTQISKLKQLFALVYLLGKNTKENIGIWPYLIPVLSSGEKYKFIKKGVDENTEVLRLFQYLMQGKQKAEWSEKVKGLYTRYNTNQARAQTEFNQKLAQVLLNEINQLFIGKQYSVSIKKEGVFEPQTCKIMDALGIIIIGLEYQLLLADFNIVYWSKNQKKKQFIFEHRMFDSVEMEIDQEKSSFLVKFLKCFQC